MQNCELDGNDGEETVRAASVACKVYISSR